MPHQELTVPECTVPLSSKLNVLSISMAAQNLARELETLGTAPSRPFTITTLPNEVLLEIFSNLDKFSSLYLGVTNKKLYNIHWYLHGTTWPKKLWYNNVCYSGYHISWFCFCKMKCEFTVRCCVACWEPLYRYEIFAKVPDSLFPPKLDMVPQLRDFVECKSCKTFKRSARSRKATHTPYPKLGYHGTDDVGQSKFDPCWDINRLQSLVPIEAWHPVFFGILWELHDSHNVFLTPDECFLLFAAKVPWSIIGLPPIKYETFLLQTRIVWNILRSPICARCLAMCLCHRFHTILHPQGNLPRRKHLHDRLILRDRASMGQESSGAWSENLGKVMQQYGNFLGDNPNLKEAQGPTEWGGAHYSVKTWKELFEMLDI